MDDDYQQSCSARSKGKCRAVPYDDVRFGEASEQSPLLVNDSLVRDDTPPRSRLRNLFYRRYDEENEINEQFHTQKNPHPGGGTYPIGASREYIPQSLSRVYPRNLTWEVSVGVVLVAGAMAL